MARHLGSASNDNTGTVFKNKNSAGKGYVRVSFKGPRTRKKAPAQIRALCHIDYPNFRGFMYERGIKILGETLAQLKKDEPSLSRLEKTALLSLVTYVAQSKGVNEKTIRSLLEARFKTDDICKIKSSEFEDAIQFLVELNPKAQLH